jgi:membrane protease YdiL (CAAX protease family)
MTSKTFIKNHPVTSFFLLTFALSWSMFILALRLFPENDLYRAPLVSVGAFAPALISIFLSAAINPGQKPREKNVRAVVFACSWIIAWVNLVLFASLVRGMPFNVLLFAAGALMALLPAFVISSAFSPHKGVRDHLSSMVRPQSHPGWYVLAVFLVPLLLFIGTTITSAIGKDIPEPQYSIEREGLAMVLLLIGLVFVSNLVNSGGAAEEPGWRGFALRRLQRRLSPLTAGLFLGFMWGLWHIPIMSAQLQAFGPAIVFFQVVQIGIAFTWFYNRTRGSILAVALLHASWNAGVGFIPRTHAFYALMAGVLIMMVCCDRMWKKKKGENHAV